MNKVIEKEAWSLRENTKTLADKLTKKVNKKGKKSHKNPYSKVCTSNIEIIRKKKGEKKADHEQEQEYLGSVSPDFYPLLFSR